MTKPLGAVPMMAEPGQRPVYICAEWEIDLARRELRSNGELVPLGGRAFEILAELVQAQGQLVTRDDLKERVTSLLSRVEQAPDTSPLRSFEPEPISTRILVKSHPDPEPVLGGGLPPMPGPDDEGGMIATLPVRTPEVDPTDESTWASTPRNAPCPCGSGKKYKHCHGRN